MEVAVGVGSNHFITLGQGKDSLRLVVGSEVLDLLTLLGLQGDPLDKVLGGSWGCSTEPTFTVTALPLTLMDGDVLLHGGVRGAGDDLGHFSARST